MDKRYDEQGRVAVLISPGHGAGWYSWHGIEPLIFDPEVVDLVLANAGADKIEALCRSKYGTDHYYGGADQLTVAWMKPGIRFRIEEYDGSESILLRDSRSTTWIQA